MKTGERFPSGRPPRGALVPVSVTTGWPVAPFGHHWCQRIFAFPISE
jgi:hypothetical protein